MLRLWGVYFWVLVTGVAVSACSATGGTVTPPAANCGGALFPVATSPVNSDPDIYNGAPTATPPQNSAAACPTPITTPTIPVNPLSKFVGGNISNLTLNPQNQSLRSMAMGHDMVALGWIEDGRVWVAVSRGGSAMQVQALGDGDDVGLTFSRANRLHVAFTNGSSIYYQFSDNGLKLTEATPIYVAEGQNPQVAVDAYNWAYVVYESGGNIYLARHLVADQWVTSFVVAASNPSVTVFHEDKTVFLYGTPIGGRWFGLYMGVERNGQAEVYRFLSWFNLWEQVASFPTPANQQLIGTVNLDYLNPDNGNEPHVYASWVTWQEATDPPPPTVTFPQILAANPFAPSAISNPQWVYDHFNAVRISSVDSTHDGALYQQATATVGQSVTFSAQGQCWSSTQNDQGASVDPANCRMAVGIDPTGGTNPTSPSVVWSGDQSPLNTFSFLSVTANAQNPLITVFLRSRPDARKAHNEVYWDAAALSGATLLNGDFEGAFSVHPGNANFSVPNNWTPAFVDDTYTGPPQKDRYFVHAAWSLGGSSWGTPFVVSDNSMAGAGTTGAIAPNAYPFISLATVPPTVTIFYIYESGDPPPDTTFIRFGRPYTTICELNSPTCTPDAPGTPLFPRTLVRPSYELFARRDTYQQTRGFIAWSSLQEDYEKREIFSTFVFTR